MSFKTSSVVVTTRVVESNSSMTSLKNVTRQRSSSGGKMIEAWSSPSLVLTSPQTWVSGPQALFLSPPKSPFPNRRITRRSSVFMKQAWGGKATSKSTPKELKISSSSMSSVSSSRSRESSIFLKSSESTTSGRRSSVYRKNSKKQGGNVALLEQEELEEVEIAASKGTKSQNNSPKRKISKLPVALEKKSNSPSRVNRNRKRNVSELDKEESPEKPASKRRKQAGDESFSVSSGKGKTSLQESLIKHSETSAGRNTSSPSKTSKKAPQKPACKTARKAAKSPSQKRTRSVRSEQSVSTKKAAKSPVTPKKAAKPPASHKKAAKSPVTPKKAAKSPASHKKAAKSPASHKKAAKSPVTPKKAAKPPASHKKAAKSPVTPKKAAKSPASHKKAAKSPVTPKKAAKSPASRKKTAKSPVTPKKAAKSPVTPRKTTKLPLHQKTRSAKSAEFESPEKAAESPVSLRKAVKSKKSPRKSAKSPESPVNAAKSPDSPVKVAKSPASRRKAAKSPVSPRKAVKSPSQKRSHSVQSASSSSIRKGRSTLSKRKVEDEEMENTDDETTVKDQVVTKSQKKKRRTEAVIHKGSLKLKSAKLSLTPCEIPRQKSPKYTSAKVKSWKSVTRKSSTYADTVSTPMSSRQAALFDSSDLEEKTPGKTDGAKKRDSQQKKTPTPAKKCKESLKGSRQKKTPNNKDEKETNVSKQKFDTPKSSSKRLSQKLRVSSEKKSLQPIGRKSEQFIGTSADSTISSRLEIQVLMKRMADTPTSTKKESTPAKSGRGKKSTASKSPIRKINKSFSTPKSNKKTERKSLKSSTKKSSSAISARSAGHKSATGKLDISDSLDGSYLQVSKHQSKQSPNKSSVSKKKTSKMDSVARSAEDDKIFDILKKAVKSTKKLATPKSETSIRRSANASPKTTLKRLQNDKFSTPKSVKVMKSPTGSGTKRTRLSQKSASSSITFGSAPRIVISGSSPQSTITLGSSLRQTPGRAVIQTSRQRLSRQNRLTPLTHLSEKASASRIRSEDILSRGLSSSIITSRGVQDGSDTDHLALKTFDGQSGAVAQTSQQGRAYHEERSFAQYIEYRGNSKVERYGTHAVERKVGDQEYRAGSYRAERKKGLQTEMEHEDHWEEGDANNSAGAISMEEEEGDTNNSASAISMEEEEGDTNNSAGAISMPAEEQEEEEDDVDYHSGSDDPNATNSTSTHSTRCTIL